MGYQFNQHESIARNINRILAEQINAAIGALENPDESKEESIHGVRKELKKSERFFGWSAVN
jgi:phage regulator Rha-like protein